MPVRYMLLIPVHLRARLHARPDDSSNGSPGDSHYTGRAIPTGLVEAHGIIVDEGVRSPEFLPIFHHWVNHVPAAQRVIKEAGIVVVPVQAQVELVFLAIELVEVSGSTTPTAFWYSSGA